MIKKVLMSVVIFIATMGSMSYGQNPVQADTNRLTRIISNRLGLDTNGATAGQVPSFNGTKVIWASGGGGGGGNVFTASNNVFTGVNTFGGAVIATNRVSLLGAATNAAYAWNAAGPGLVFTNGTLGASIFLDSQPDWNFFMNDGTRRIRFGFPTKSVLELSGPSASDRATFGADMRVSGGFVAELLGNITLGDDIGDALTVGAPTWTAANGINVNSGQWHIQPGGSITTTAAITNMANSVTSFWSHVNSTNVVGMASLHPLQLRTLIGGSWLVDTNGTLTGLNASGAGSGTTINPVTGRITVASTGFALTRTGMTPDSSAGFELRQSSSSSGAVLSLRSDGAPILLGIGNGTLATNMVTITARGTTIGGTNLVNNPGNLPIFNAPGTNYTFTGFAAILAGAEYVTNMTFNGAVTNGVYLANPSAFDSRLNLQAICTNANVITIIWQNHSAGASVTPPDQTVYVNGFTRHPSLP